MAFVHLREAPARDCPDAAMVRRNRGEDLRPLEEEAQFTSDTTAGDLLKPLDQRGQAAISNSSSLASPTVTHVPTFVLVLTVRIFKPAPNPNAATSKYQRWYSTLR